ncbi:hypothetical protein [Streptomyces sp. NRRL F-5135]|uniref:hypothetical protein n=1 Tax=Streptomyces sp. NRRL F-5135 TaxID=1463858 RepID=UPI000A605AF5
MSYPNLLTPEEQLADAKDRLRIPRIVVICGSTRFMQEMADADCELTWAGHIVVKPGCDMKTPHPLWASEADAEAGGRWASRSGSRIPKSTPTTPPRPDPVHPDPNPTNTTTKGPT